MLIALRQSLFAVPAALAVFAKPKAIVVPTLLLLIAISPVVPV